jgi:fumarate hydratase, class II
VIVQPKYVIEKERKSMPSQSLKTVHDSLGQLDIPANAYYGAQTARALANFPVSGLVLQREFIRAQAIIKYAAACAHAELGVMDQSKANAICQAAEEVMSGTLDSWFQIDVYQAGAGTSQNMNANEVIAARATELLGGQQGDAPLIHANDDVNKSQSTNDTIHVAMQIAGMEMLAQMLDPALHQLEQGLRRKSVEFANIVKSGRTHLQDAVPMRLGDEFGAYADNVARHRRWVEQAAHELLALGMGGNAIGTGINTVPGFAERAVHHIARKTGLAFGLAKNPFVFNQNPDEIVHVSGALRTLAQALGRIANDLRLLASGPRTGLAEVTMPTVQPGSSIMPGKVNPVMAEMMNMIVFQVGGCDTSVALAGAAGQLELNVMMPVMAYNFLHEIRILANGSRLFAEKAIFGIEANEATCRKYADHSLSLATALNLELGYEEAAKVVKYALSHDLSLRVACQQLGVPEAYVERALNIDHLSIPVMRHISTSPQHEQGD